MNFWNLLFPPPGKDRFARLMIGAIKEIDPESQATYDPAQFRLMFPNGGMFNLHNVYREYCSTPFLQRKAVLRRFAGVGTMVRNSSVAKSLSFAEARPNILPRVRERFYYERLLLDMKLREKENADASFMPRRLALNEMLEMELVIDFPDSIKSVVETELKEWGVSFEQAVELARENLWKKSVKDFTPVAQGVYISPWKDNHDASRLFLHDLIWQLKVKGDHVCAIPNRDILIVAGADDPAALLIMAKLIQEVLKLPRPMMGTPMRLREGKWTVLELAPEHPAYSVVHNLTVESIAGDYKDQKELLDAIHRKSGRDVFVGSCELVKRKNQAAWRSVSFWTQGVLTWLPRTQDIIFGQVVGTKATMLATVPWERAQSVVGDLMSPLGMYPERYEVKGFPTPQQIAAMGAL